MNGVELSLATEYMIEYMKPEGTFLFYSIIAFLGLFFVIYVLKETQGLTDKQKKELYLPDSLKDLTDSEDHQQVSVEDSLPTPQDDLELTV